MLESIYEVLFFSSLRIGNIFFDLILPFILVLVIYDVLLRYLANVNYWQLFKPTIKHILLNLFARIILLYSFVFISLGIYNLSILLADYWLIAVLLLSLLIISSVTSMIMVFSPKKKRSQSPTEFADQAEIFRRIRK